MPEGSSSQENTKKKMPFWKRICDAFKDDTHDLVNNLCEETVTLQTYFESLIEDVRSLILYCANLRAENQFLTERVAELERKITELESRNEQTYPPPPYPNSTESSEYTDGDFYIVNSANHTDLPGDVHCSHESYSS